jgi:hypothetical protein
MTPEMEAYQLISDEFERRAKNHTLYVPLEDFIQECWLALLEQDTDILLSVRITNAIKISRKKTRPYQLYGEHILEHPVGLQPVVHNEGC